MTRSLRSRGLRGVWPLPIRLATSVIPEPVSMGHPAHTANVVVDPSFLRILDQDIPCISVIVSVLDPAVELKRAFWVIVKPRVTGVVRSVVHLESFGKMNGSIGGKHYRE